MTQSIGRRQPPRVSIVTPFYNEEASVLVYFGRLACALGALSHQYDFEFVCVNDGSKDATLDKLKSVTVPFGRMSLIDLSRNFGKEAALSAGLDYASGDAVVPIDADLQDPPELIPEMLERWQAGIPVILAVRSDRMSDGRVKRATAGAFYALHNWLASIPIPPNVGDFRLMDRAVVDVVRGMPERQRFMKGLMSWSGFPTETIEYKRAVRVAGQTKWSYPKLLGLAIEGITSFSTAPLRLATILGAAFAVSAMLYGCYLALNVTLHGADVPGYASIFVAVVFMGGVQLLSLGILGEYVGRTYMETKHRPVYVVKGVLERGITPAPIQEPIEHPSV